MFFCALFLASFHLSFLVFIRFNMITSRSHYSEISNEINILVWQEPHKLPLLRHLSSFLLHIYQFILFSLIFSVFLIFSIVFRDIYLISLHWIFFAITYYSEANEWHFFLTGHYCLWPYSVFISFSFIFHRSSCIYWLIYLSFLFFLVYLYPLGQRGVRTNSERDEEEIT